MKHEGACPRSTPNCVNCNNGTLENPDDAKHVSISSSCPKFIEQKRINNIMAYDNLSFAEARAIICPKKPNPNFNSSSFTGKSAENYPLLSQVVSKANQTKESSQKMNSKQQQNKTHQVNLQHQNKQQQSHQQLKEQQRNFNAKCTCMETANLLSEERYMKNHQLPAANSDSRVMAATTSSQLHQPILKGTDKNNKNNNSLSNTLTLNNCSSLTFEKH
uniref:Uncharacterized protein n=1 Tax=Trichogramma kaykai TaxID=54128 RepID=A0ABD2XDN6_9HYME